MFKEINEFYKLVWDYGILGKIYILCILYLTFATTFLFTNLFINP